MSDPTWMRVSPVDAVPLREGRVVMLAGKEIALFNLGDRFLAIDNRCPHKQGPLADGIVSGHTVVCPLHAWKIDLETGSVARPTGPSACVTSYDVKVEDGIVIVAVPGPVACARDGEAA